MSSAAKAVSATSDTGITAGDTSPPTTLLGRFVVAPVLFISFVISLLLIDRENSAVLLQRHHQAPRHGLDVSSPDSKHDHGRGKEDYYYSHRRKLARREMEDAFRIRGKVIVSLLATLGLVAATVGWLGFRAFSSWVERPVAA